MNTATAVFALSAEEVAFFRENGYLIVRGLFSPAEVAEIKAVFDDLGAKGQAVGHYWNPDTSPAAALDPLRRYPRVMMPHRFEPVAYKYLLDQRVHDVLAELLGEEPIAAQSMFYYKPPGGRGQAFHQDNFYLPVRPGTCVAAWTAVDASHLENGGLWVVPGTHKLDVACPEQADTDESFTSDLVRPPPGTNPVPADLEPGDVLFFGGSVIHGSPANSSPTKWRRSYICHYIPRSSAECSHWYAPLLDFEGGTVPCDPATGGGPCGGRAV